MIKCYWIPVSAITCLTPRSEFPDEAIQSLAESIVATDGLLRPLIVVSLGYLDMREIFQVIDNSLEYWAAVRAKELNPRLEEVNAFLIAPSILEAAAAQLECLQGITPR
jgi:hypothetical protein